MILSKAEALEIALDAIDRSRDVFIAMEEYDSDELDEAERILRREMEDEE